MREVVLSCDGITGAAAGASGARGASSVAAAGSSGVSSTGASGCSAGAGAGAATGCSAIAGVTGVSSPRFFRAPKIRERFFAGVFVESDVAPLVFVSLLALSTIAGVTP
jgi:hypothetical protein